MVERHIFLVDDEVMITTSLALILGRRGYKVSTFNNPLEALKELETTSPDLLISDVMMPELSGVELAIRTKKSRPQCKILLFSAYASDLLQRAWAAGHEFRLLQKPLHPEALLREIALIHGF